MARGMEMSSLVEVIDMLGAFGGIFISIECDGEFGGYEKRPYFVRLLGYLFSPKMAVERNRPT